jgi:hypothetical protein
MRLPTLALIIGAVALMPALAAAHCDTMDGPVVADAKMALEKGDLAVVLKWVKPEDEAVIRDVFKKTLNVRGLNQDARELADMWFFETLVRIHRATEGEPFTGVKPAGTPLEPGIAPADEALRKGADDELLKAAPEKERPEIHKRFLKAAETRKHKDDSVELGREFVAAYVAYMHHVEEVFGGGEHEHGEKEGHEGGDGCEKCGK